ncbi:MAG: hypothetical protein A2138_16935 [Deltaproteobacteria bacterium RBG_16_71_12]|nr:MAG: hypothetical protein A2138_16935 [Deltaproteobacteria bacterium RBG_16_71_12]
MSRATTAPMRRLASSPSHASANRRRLSSARAGARQRGVAQLALDLLDVRKVIPTHSRCKQP